MGTVVDRAEGEECGSDLGLSCPTGCLVISESLNSPGLIQIWSRSDNNFDKKYSSDVARGSCVSFWYTPESYAVGAV